MNNYVSVVDAAKILGYTVQHTRLLIRHIKLKGEKISGIWLIKKESLEDYITAKYSSSLFNSDSFAGKTHSPKDTIAAQ